METEGPTFLDLVKANHEFPGPYIFKVIGFPAEGFIARVLLAFREELNLSTDPPFILRQSSHGKYVSLTLEPYLMTADEVIALYRKIQTIKGLVTVC